MIYRSLLSLGWQYHNTTVLNSSTLCTMIGTHAFVVENNCQVPVNCQVLKYSTRSYHYSGTSSHLSFKFLLNHAH